MTTTFVLSALVRKRAEVSGQIQDLEKALNRCRANLANIDSTIRLFAADMAPEEIKPIRLRKRAGYFAQRELPRLILDVLRLAPNPIGSFEIADAIMRAKNLPIEDEDLRQRVAKKTANLLAQMVKRGTAVRHGVRPHLQWAAVSELL